MVTAKARGETQLAPQNWTHIYILLAIALSVEGTIIQMLPFEWYWRVVIYVLVSALTGYLFMCHRPFQGRLGRLQDFEKGWR